MNEMLNNNNVVISCIGLDKPGVVAGITKILADYSVNILEIKQSIIKELFSLIMVVDISKSEASFADIKEKLETLAKALGVQILVQHENIFRYMHRV